MFELEWEYWCERLNIYCNGVGVFLSLGVYWIWGESISVSVWVFVTMELGVFKFQSVVGLKWKHCYERLSICYDGFGSFQGIKQLGNE